MPLLNIRVPEGPHVDIRATLAVVERENVRLAGEIRRLRYAAEHLKGELEALRAENALLLAAPTPPAAEGRARSAPESPAEAGRRHAGSRVGPPTRSAPGAPRHATAA